MTEMDKLIAALVANRIPFQVKPCWDNSVQVIYPMDGPKRVCDAVCHNSSYGHQEGLLEIMGLVNGDEVGDDVEGWLTAEEVFRRISEHYNANR